MKTAVFQQAWSRLASGMWLGQESGHSSKRKTALEQGNDMDGNSSRNMILLKMLALALFIIAGLNWFGSSLISNLGIIQPNQELPLAHLEGIVVDQQNNIFLGNQFYGQIQMYDTEGNFQKGWFIDANGGSFRLRLNEQDNLEVATARTNLLYVFDLKDDNVSIIENAEAYDDFGDKNESIYTFKDDTLYRISFPILWPQVIRMSPQNQSNVVISISPYSWFFTGVIPAMLFGLLGILFSSLAYRYESKLCNQDEN